LRDEKFGMAISRKTIKRIKAIAEDQRGDPAVRAVAQKKLAELQIIPSEIIPSGFYNDVANWTKDHPQIRADQGPHGRSKG